MKAKHLRGTPRA